ncbi:MAG TPA: ABC transporter ATP-binding protein [Chloroflexota bacterium]|nr:ABC transporter ATP-binding protein [Chloroflexota bacterium]
MNATTAGGAIVHKIPTAPSAHASNSLEGPVLAVRDLRVTYAGGVQAVRGVDLEVAPGETLAIVGESGCGKSTLAAAILRLLPGSAIVSGQVHLAGVDVYGGPEPDVRRVRGQLAGLVVQDPMNSFDPVQRVGSHVIEARRLHDRHMPAGRLWSWAAKLLSELQIVDATRRVRQYPHEWSGGMRQRAAIAAAAANGPKLLLADEPTASLDASLAADVVHGLRERQLRDGAAMLLITHQLGLASQVADRVAVMYAGCVVETGEAEQVINRPRHPYTRALVAALPRPGAGLPTPLEGEPPRLAPPPPGCAFSARCVLSGPGCAVGPVPVLSNGIACPVVLDHESRSTPAAAVQPYRVEVVG